MSSPFLPLVKQIMVSMKLEIKEPKQPNELLGDNILYIIWARIPKEQRDEYDMFLPAFQNLLWDICTSESILAEVHSVLEEYLNKKQG